MARLETLPSTSSEGLTTPNRHITQDLSNPNEKMKEKIKQLFGRAKHPTMPKQVVKSSKTKPCHVSKPFHRKRITVVCVDRKTFSTPNRKARDKLVEEGKIKEVYIGKTGIQSAVIEKFRKYFPT